MKEIYLALRPQRSVDSLMDVLHFLTPASSLVFPVVPTSRVTSAKPFYHSKLIKYGWMR